MNSFEADSLSRERLLGLLRGKLGSIEAAAALPVLVSLSAQEIRDVWSTASVCGEKQARNDSGQYFGHLLVQSAALKFVGDPQAPPPAPLCMLPPPFLPGADVTQNEPAPVVKNESDLSIGEHRIKVIYRGIHGALVEVEKANEHPDWFFLEGRPERYGGDGAEIALYGAVTGAGLAARNERPAWLARAAVEHGKYLIRPPYEISARELLRPADCASTGKDKKERRLPRRGLILQS